MWVIVPGVLEFSFVCAALEQWCFHTCDKQGVSRLLSSCHGRQTQAEEASLTFVLCFAPPGLVPPQFPVLVRCNPVLAVRDPSGPFLSWVLELVFIPTVLTKDQRVASSYVILIHFGSFAVPASIRMAIWKCKLGYFTATPEPLQWLLWYFSEMKLYTQSQNDAVLTRAYWSLGFLGPSHCLSRCQHCCSNCLAVLPSTLSWGCKNGHPPVVPSAASSLPYLTPFIAAFSFHHWLSWCSELCPCLFIASFSLFLACVCFFLNLLALKARLCALLGSQGWPFLLMACFQHLSINGCIFLFFPARS